MAVEGYRMCPERSFAFPVWGNSRNLVEETGVSWGCPPHQMAQFAIGSIPSDYTLQIKGTEYSSGEVPHLLVHVHWGPSLFIVRKAKQGEVRVVLDLPGETAAALEISELAQENTLSVFPCKWTMQIEREDQSLRQILLLDPMNYPRFRFLFTKSLESLPRVVGIVKFSDIRKQETLKNSIEECNARFEEIAQAYRKTLHDWILKGEGSEEKVRQSLAEFHAFYQERRSPIECRKDYSAVFLRKEDLALSAIDHSICEILQRVLKDPSHKEDLQEMCTRGEKIFPGHYQMILERLEPQIPGRNHMCWNAGREVFNAKWRWETEWKRGAFTQDLIVDERGNPRGRVLSSQKPDEGEETLLLSQSFHQHVVADLAMSIRKWGYRFAKIWDHYNTTLYHRIMRDQGSVEEVGRALEAFRNFHKEPRSQTDYQKDYGVLFSEKQEQIWDEMSCIVFELLEKYREDRDDLQTQEDLKMLCERIEAIFPGRYQMISERFKSTGSS